MPFVDTSELDVREPREGWKGRFFHSDNMTFAYYTVSAGSWVHEHTHPNEEVWFIIEGDFEVTHGEEKRKAGPGIAAVVPANEPHSIRALTDGRAIVVDHPRRESVGGASLD
jgi:quercetin dioxygenase-like cupin family protein